MSADPYNIRGCPETWEDSAACPPGGGKSPSLEEIAREIFETAAEITEEGDPLQGYFLVPREVMAKLETALEGKLEEDFEESYRDNPEEL